jgi:hypothetical protein
MGTPCVQFFKNKEMIRFVIFTPISLASSLAICALLGNGISEFSEEYQTEPER